MRRMYTLFILILAVSSCHTLEMDVDESKKNELIEYGGYYLVAASFDESTVSPYTPTEPDHRHDWPYMTAINRLIEEKAREISNDRNYINLAKAIAYAESNWQHYVKYNNKYYVILDRDGHSFGMMQINDLYHEREYCLDENLEYGLEIIYHVYHNAVKQDCPQGTNRGDGLDEVIRRSYAQYNGGPAAICRDGNANDDRLLGDFNDRIWENYL